MHPPAVPTLCHTQISRCGRWVGRLRNLHRPSRSSKPNFKGVALNTQGLNWRLLSHAHKLRALIQTAWERQWSFVMLFELHFCTEDWQDPEPKAQVVYLEEFVLVQWYRVGILLNTVFRTLWEQGGQQLQPQGERLLQMTVRFHSATYTLISGYAPVQSETGARRHFFDSLSALLDSGSQDRLLIGGDWNGHIGSDSLGHGMNTPTTRGGHDVLQWMAGFSFLSWADHLHPIKNRGTWRHSQNKKWYELDYFIISKDVKPLIQHARVQPYVFSDHLAKVLTLHFDTGQRKPWKGARFAQAKQHSHDLRLDLHAMKGPSSTAKTIRNNMQNRMTELLQPYLPHLHLLPPLDGDVTYIFVDGSFSGRPNQALEDSSAAGW